MTPLRPDRDRPVACQLTAGALVIDRTGELGLHCDVPVQVTAITQYPTGTLRVDYTILDDTAFGCFTVDRLTRVHVLNPTGTRGGGVR